jgi:hypothetical protein
MADEIRERARKLFRAPFRYQGGYIWDDEGEMVADRHGDAEAKSATLRVRGWGRLGYITKSPEEAAALQDTYGELIAEAMTAHFGRLKATLVPSDDLARLKAERQRATELLAAVLPFTCVSDDSLTVGQHLDAVKAIDEAGDFLAEMKKR